LLIILWLLKFDCETDAKVQKKSDIVSFLCIK